MFHKAHLYTYLKCHFVSFICCFKHYSHLVEVGIVEVVVIAVIVVFIICVTVKTIVAIYGAN